MAAVAQFAARSRNTSFGARGTLYITGWQAVSAALTNEAVNVKGRAVDATDTAAQMVEEAQRSSGSFVDRSGRTRRSIENMVVPRSDGYARWIGSTHYVSRFLVFGTVKMSPKWDLFGASQAGIDWWERRMEEVSTL